MRISADTRQWRRYHVTLNGEDITDICKEADEEAGRVLVMVFSPEKPSIPQVEVCADGGFQCNWFHDHRGYCQISKEKFTEERFGVVVIEQIPERPGDKEEWNNFFRGAA